MHPRCVDSMSVCECSERKGSRKTERSDKEENIGHMNETWYIRQVLSIHKMDGCKLCASIISRARLCIKRQ